MRIRQADVAKHVGINHVTLNRLLAGKQPLTEDMESRINAAVVMLTRAELAAEEAREKVLRVG